MGNTKRPSWHEHWMKAAYNASEMATCPSRAVGCVLVKDKRLLATGFNGVPSGYPHPTVCERKEQGFKTGERLDLCVCNHSEANALATAARHGIPVLGSTAYVTVQPCQQCMGLLVNAGIRLIIYDREYPNEKSITIAMHANIEVIQFEHINK